MEKIDINKIKNEFYKKNPQTQEIAKMNDDTSNEILKEVMRLNCDMAEIIINEINKKNE